MDWKYALSLDLHDPGFDFTLLHDFRERLVAHEVGHRFLDTFLTTCKARGWTEARGTQRTDSTHVLAAIRTLHRLECAEAMHYARRTSSARRRLPGCSSTCRWTGIHAMACVRTRCACEGGQQARALAQQVGLDGYQLLDAVWLPPAHRTSAPCPPWRRSGRSG